MNVLSEKASLSQPDGARAMPPHWYTLVARLADGRWHSPAELAEGAPDLARLAEYGLEIERDAARGWRLARPLELLDAARIAAELGPAQRRALALETFPVLDSTNRYLLEHPDTGPRACLAEYQSAGRGRRGKSWLSPFASGLCLSLQRQYPAPPPPALNLALAVGVLRVLERFGAGEVGLKWPNDTLWRARYKLAGLLTETRLAPNGTCRLVAGLGLNLALPEHAARGPDQPWTDLQTVLGGPVARNTLAGRLIRELHAVLEDYPRLGFAPFLADWQRLDVLAGQAVSVRTAQGTAQGVACGVDGDGALLLRQADGLRRYYAGEVSVRLDAPLDAARYLDCGAVPNL